MGKEFYCSKCKGKVYYSGLCRKCFIKSVIKKIRKDLRVNKVFKKNDVLLVKDKISDIVVKDIVKDPSIKIVKKGRFTKEVLPLTMDDEIDSFLGNLFSGKKMKKINKKKVGLFRVLKDDELKAFARAKKIKLKEKKRSKIMKMLDKFEKRYPSVKYSLGRSIGSLRRIN